MDEGKQLVEFARACNGQFALVNGRIATCRKLGARPPASLIPPAVLRLHDRYIAGEIKKENNPNAWYDARKVLRRFCLLEPDDIARRPRLVSNAESCKRWQRKVGLCRPAPTCEAAAPAAVPQSRPSGTIPTTARQLVPAA